MNTCDAGQGPVFVVGMNGSGTTMLLDCLGRHSRLYAFPRETRVMPYLFAHERDYGDLRVDANFRRLWDDVRGLEVFRQAHGEAVALPEDWQALPRRLASVLDAVFGQFAARQRKSRWCEKTPQHVQHMALLAREFPQARFVHVIRDGRDCAASFQRRWRRRPELTMFRWKKAVALGRAQGAALGPSRYLEVRYEDLTAHPDAGLRRIAAFLGVPFEPAMLQSAQPYLKRASGVVVGSLERNSGKWRAHFDDAGIDRLERIAGRTLAEFGYATRRPDGDRDPAGWRRRWWSTTDSLRQYAREVSGKLTGRLERPWRTILAKPMTARRHRQHNVY